jgi:hypothetical protein
MSYASGSCMRSIPYLRLINIRSLMEVTMCGAYLSYNEREGYEPDL